MCVCIKHFIYQTVSINWKYSDAQYYNKISMSSKTLFPQNCVYKYILVRVIM